MWKEAPTLARPGHGVVLIAERAEVDAAVAAVCVDTLVRARVRLAFVDICSFETG